MNQKYDTNYRLLYTDPDTGMLCIVIPSGEVPMEQVAKGSVPSELEYWQVDKNDVPKDRSFRDAWELDESIAGNSHGIGEGEK
jgi:hypothetical protein